MLRVKGIANIFAVYVSKLRAIGLYHDLNLKDNLQDLRIPFEPYSPLNNQLIHL